MGRSRQGSAQPHDPRVVRTAVTPVGKTWTSARLAESCAHFGARRQTNAPCCYCSHSNHCNFWKCIVGDTYLVHLRIALSRCASRGQQTEREYMGGGEQGG
eukprot:5528803-Pleurochrysis_carterae.AAC.1